MSQSLSQDSILPWIFHIRGRRVILDIHIAALYGVQTRALKQQVRRNIERFPEDFMFELTPVEWEEVITDCDNPPNSKLKYSPVAPFAFTEQGVAMLSGVLRSETAIQVNIAIMRAFVQMRGVLEENKELWRRLELLESQCDAQFKMVFDAIRDMRAKRAEPRERIGFKP